MELSQFCLSEPLCCPGFSFVYRAVLTLEIGQVVRAVINNVHIELEHNITRSVCFSLLEFIGIEMKPVLLQPVYLCNV